MADDIGADDFAEFNFGGEYGSESAIVEIKETGKRDRGSQDAPEDEEETNAKKKRKKQKSNKASKFIKERDETQSIRTAPASDQCAFLQRMCFSSLESGETFSVDDIACFEESNHSAEDHMYSMMEQMNKSLTLKLGSELKPGSPTVLIISSSAVGCLPFLSGIRKTKTNWKLIKLFAKHIKQKQQEEMLQRPVSIGVGTPNRIQQLITSGALKLDQCKLIIIDGAENVKRQTIFDIKELKADFISLFQMEFQPLITQSHQISLALF